MNIISGSVPEIAAESHPPCYLIVWSQRQPAYGVLPYSVYFLYPLSIA